MDNGYEIGKAVLKMCKEQGIPYEIVHIPIDKKLDEAVRKYVMEIEEATNRPPNPKLIFKGYYSY